jgi:Ca2+-binding RTX toxin-like protein
MAVVSFANLDQTLDQTLELVTFTGAGTVVRNSENYAWTSNTAPVNGVYFNGTGFTFDGGNVPTGGTVTSFTLDLTNDGASGAELQITGLSLNLTALAPLVNGGLTAAQQNDLIWRTVLAGNDTVNLGSGGFYVDFSADGRNVASGLNLFGGADTITGTVGSGFIQGDYLVVAAGGRAVGGNDIITVTGVTTVTGDVYTVAGFVTGGADTITTAAAIVGDGYDVVAGGVLVGGNDTITALGLAIGDANGVAGTLVGGNDTITGSNADQGLYGDAHTVSAGGFLLGGNDTIRGGGGDDGIYGDWVVLSGTARGGNDMLFGEAGNDTIFGNGGDDLLDGGADNDTLHGGDGDDTMLGGTGDDTFLGGDGNDTMTGGDGTDTMVGEGGADVVYGSDGIDYLDGRAGGDYLSGDNGNDIIFGDGYPTTFGAGSDLILGGEGNDILMGESGDHATTVGMQDQINGGNGNDTIFGGAGNDWLFGEGGTDVMEGGFGSDLLIGGNGADTMLGSGTSIYAAASTEGDLFGYQSLLDGGDAIYGFDFNGGTGTDGIDLRTLFDAIGYAGTNARADGYLYVFQNGANIDVYVDGDGAAGGVNLTRMFSLMDANASATSLTDSFFLFQ